MNFILGCNYWASNAGIEMWRNFDLDAIEADIRTLSENGIGYLRVFPLWRDFQPVLAHVRNNGIVLEYAAYGISKKENKYYLDEEMLDRFSVFLDLCDKYNIKVIVGLITGWMSGGLFVPPALHNKNILTDPVSQYFQALFIKGFVSRFKDRSAIYAWDLGNECNCMEEIKSRYEAASWTALVANSIKAEDNTRPVVSGMHGNYISNNWTLEDISTFTDILTTHPYAYWCKHTRIDDILAYRTLVHPTAQAKFYADIGKAPCLTEEMGTMSPMLCNDEKAVSLLRINLFSLWANGSTGFMWWCASDQDMLDSFPYTLQTVERELGMFDKKHKPKPVLFENKKFDEFLKSSKINLPAAKTDAVCLLTRGQDEWGIAYMTYALARKAGLNICYSYEDSELPQSDIYLMPSINGVNIMEKEKFEKLLGKVYDGADLYISFDNAVLSNFESFSGLAVTESYEHNETVSADIDGKIVSFTRLRNMIFEPTSASVLVYDNKNTPFITVNNYGKGRVFVVNAPVEKELITRHNAFDDGVDVIYRKIFADRRDSTPITLGSKDIIMTYHPENDGGYAVLLNFCSEDTDTGLSLKDGVEIEKVFYGNEKRVAAFDACVLKIRKVK